MPNPGFSQNSFTDHSLYDSLPNPFLYQDGRRVEHPDDWPARRQEILKLLTSQMYGAMPSAPHDLTFEVVEPHGSALDGIAIRKQVVVHLGKKSTDPTFNLLIYVPAHHSKPVPAFLGLNFLGNHTIIADSAILLTSAFVESWNPSGEKNCVKDHHATDACRGIDSVRWPVKTIIERGYALITLYREEIASDRPSYAFSTGIHPFFPELQTRPDNFGTIAAWAWAMSRALDYLSTQDEIDPQRVVAYGWSRLGKAALWAGATDPRFAMVISNESGAGGAKLFQRNQGENIERLCKTFPHWFAHAFRAYMKKDQTLPFDQHFVLSLIAPRPLYISSAEEDLNSDPVGEFASLLAANPVYHFLGTDGFPSDVQPGVNQAVFGTMGYHIRSGGHDVTAYDWQQWLDFADRHLVHVEKD